MKTVTRLSKESAKLTALRNQLPKGIYASLNTSHELEAIQNFPKWRQDMQNLSKTCNQKVKCRGCKHVMLMSHVIPHLTEFKRCEGNIGELSVDEDCTWTGSDKDVEWIKSELKAGKDPKYFGL